VQSVSAELVRVMKLARAEATQVSTSLLCGSAGLTRLIVICNYVRIHTVVLIC
jgi:hypothetical protein